LDVVTSITLVGRPLMTCEYRPKTRSNRQSLFSSDPDRSRVSPRVRRRARDRVRATATATGARPRRRANT